MAEALPNGRSKSRYLAYAITTTLAALLNILVLLVICLGVMPSINKAVESAEKSAAETARSRAVIENNTRELEEHRNTIKRLNALLDIAEARVKEAEAKKKKTPE